MNVQPTHPGSVTPDQEPVSPSIPIVYENEDYRWEYKHIHKNMDEEGPLDEAELNKLGKEGWELVAVFARNKNMGHYYFKRPAA